MVPKESVPMDKWSPTNLVPYFQISTACHPGQTEYSRDHLSRGFKFVRDHLSMETEFLGTICPWGLNWLGTVCLEGPINWGPIVGDQMSGDHMRLGPNVSQPTKRMRFVCRNPVLGRVLRHFSTVLFKIYSVLKTTIQKPFFPYKSPRYRKVLVQSVVGYNSILDVAVSALL